MPHFGLSNDKFYLFSLLQLFFFRYLLLLPVHRRTYVECPQLFFFFFAFILGETARDALAGRGICEVFCL